MDRVKSNHPATFEEALAAYKDAMMRARAHIVEHDIATIPAGEQIFVTHHARVPAHGHPVRGLLRAAQVRQERRSGIYIVTPSVGDDPNAMREHNYACISNTSVHEAYPGHHLQLSAAIRHPSLVRLRDRRPRVRRGLGHVQRADDARAGLRQRPRLPCSRSTPTRSGEPAGSSWTSGCTAAS